MSTITAIGACDWCGASFVPNLTGRPRRYCSAACRTDAGHYRAALPGWLDTLADREASAAGYKRGVPAFLATEIDGLRRAIAAGPKEMHR
jgi:hypothetical protein